MVGMDLTIASFDAISEVNMVSIIKGLVRKPTLVKLDFLLYFR